MAIVSNQRIQNQTNDYRNQVKTLACLSVAIGAIAAAGSIYVTYSNIQNPSNCSEFSVLGYKLIDDVCTLDKYLVGTSLVLSALSISIAKSLFSQSQRRIAH